MGLTRRLVLDLNSPRMVWQAPSSFVEALVAAGGAEWSVVVVSSLADSDGDGASGSPEALAVAAGAEVYIGWGVSEAVLAAGRGTLRWVHSAAAGVSASLKGSIAEAGVIFTNSAGVHADPMAEWVVAALLHFLRGFDLAARAQVEGRWGKADFTVLPSPLGELCGSRVVVFGLGGVGSAVARRLAALGAEVWGVRRRADKGGPAGVRVVGPEGLASALSGASALVVSAPLTPATRGAVGARELALLGPGAVVVNVSRGTVLEEGALLASLGEGRLRGAALDVFAREPLPSGHPFWSHPRMLVTPHVSAVSPRFWERERALVLENWSRYREGRELLNVVDLGAGY